MLVSIIRLIRILIVKSVAANASLYVEDVSPAVHMLRKMFSPLPRMHGAIAGSPPIKLGRQVDALLDGRNASAEDRLTILRIRLHASSRELFTYHMGLALGWTTLESDMLWTKIQFPPL